MRNDPINPHLIERSDRPVSYVCLPGNASRYCTSNIADAMRFSPGQAAGWALPFERVISLETALQSLAS